MPPLRYRCHRAPSTIVIDGDLGKSVWDTASWTDSFVDIEGDVKPKPALLTRAKMLWDDDFFFVGAELVEPRLWATITEKNAVIFHDNDFEVFIDPDGDTLNYYEFEINALGTIWELMLPKPYHEGGNPVSPWNLAELKTVVRIDGHLNDPNWQSRGWSVEMAFPFTGLAKLWNNTHPSVGDCWRVNFSRVEWDLEVSDGAFRKVANQPEHNWVWSPQGIIDMHRPEKWGYVEFVK